MILKRLCLALVLVTGAALIVALFVAPVSADIGLRKGSTVLSFQLARGDGDFVTAENGTGFISAYDHSEWGGQAQVQHLVSNNWGVAVSFGLGTFKETNEPGTNAPAAPDFEYSQSSWNVRFGFDRYAHITSGFHIYAGPGIQIWNGKQTRDDGTPPDLESESASRIALSGRLGTHVSLSESVGLNGHIGGYIGRASADDAGAEARWSPSGNDGAVGIAFRFH